MNPARASKAVRLAVLAALVPAIAAAAPAPAGLQPGPGQLFYERTLISAAGARCRLFAPEVAAALSASTLQARNAAMRSGADRASLAAVDKRARDKAATTACNSPDLALVGERVKSGFAGYAKLTSMSFPGDLASWKADRGGTSRNPPPWRLSQSARAPQGPVTFGLVSDVSGEALIAVAGWPGALAASGARIVVRDLAKSPMPYIDKRRNDLAGRTAPRSVTTAYLASGRSPAPAALLPAGALSGAAFRFSPAVVRALEGLDPREALVLELVYPTRDGERLEAVALEVGDFAAGRAFLMAGR
jgi:hypothetical protein